MSGYAFSSVDELGEGFGFRKVRSALGVTAFGVNAIVYPPGYVGFKHWHDEQDEYTKIVLKTEAAKQSSKKEEHQHEPA